MILRTILALASLALLAILYLPFLFEPVSFDVVNGASLPLYDVEVRGRKDTVRLDSLLPGEDTSGGLRPIGDCSIEIAYTFRGTRVTDRLMGYWTPGYFVNCRGRFYGDSGVSFSGNCVVWNQF